MNEWQKSELIGNIRKAEANEGKLNESQLKLYEKLVALGFDSFSWACASYDKLLTSQGEKGDNKKVTVDDKKRDDKTVTEENFKKELAEIGRAYMKEMERQQSKRSMQTKKALGRN